MTDSTTTTETVRDVKIAPTNEPVDEGIRKRWSPRAFSDRRVTGEELRVLLEAARWAPSSYNEQPWRFIVARRSDGHEFRRMLGCFTDQNSEWASGAPVLMLSVAKRVFERTGEENRHAFHDVGLAMGNLLNQAIEMDIYVHQMAGIHPVKAREVYDIPEGFDVVAGVALGYLGDPGELEDDDRRDAETSPRSRKPLEELVFADSWGSPAEFVGDRHQLAHGAAAP